MQDLYDNAAMQNLRKGLSEYEKEQALFRTEAQRLADERRRHLRDWLRALVRRRRRA